MVNTSDTAWAAGLFEGEGCISKTSNGSGKMYPRLVVVSSDLDVLQKFHSIIGCGYIYLKKDATNRFAKKTQYQWQCNKKDEIKTILISFLPFLGDRRSERALEILSMECLN